MDPLHFCIALGPLAVYLLLLGILNLSRWPFITTGARDTAALGVAISGFAIAGPMELFMPETTALQFAGFVGFVWLLMIAFYSLSLVLLVLLMRPRIVLYNVTPEQLRPVLASVAAELDKDARWAGESLMLPQFGIQLHVEPLRTMRNAQLVATGARQNYSNWRKLELALRSAFRQHSGAPNPYGYFLIAWGTIFLAMVFYWMVTDRAGVVQSLDEMLRR